MEIHLINKQGIGLTPILLCGSGSIIYPKELRYGANSMNKFAGTERLYNL